MSRILIIDDEKSVTDSCALVLSGAGHRIATATDGLAGIKLLQQEPADLILTDLHMPYGGLPVIQQLHKLHPKIPIIAMSGAGKPQLDLAGVLGAQRTLTKPFTPGQLLAVVSAVLPKPPENPTAE